MFLANIGDEMYHWYSISDKIDILVAALRYILPIYVIEKVINILILPPTSENCHHHKVSNIGNTFSGTEKLYVESLEKILKWFCEEFWGFQPTSIEFSSPDF